MFRFNVTSSMLSNKITSSQDYSVCSVTGHWQWLGHHADGQQLVSSLPALESACSRFCFVMAMDAGSSPETYLVLDQGFSLVSESLRKTLAVILKTDVRSVPSGGFNSRWSLLDQILQHVSIAKTIFSLWNGSGLVLEPWLKHAV